MHRTLRLPCSVLLTMYLMSGCDDATETPPGARDMGRATPADMSAQRDIGDAPDMARDMGEDPGDRIGQCGEVEGFGPAFPGVIERWRAQDDGSAWPDDSIVFVGSSSIRRWDGLARTFSDYRPIQRGFGGAQLGEVALFAQDLVTRHSPRAVVVFAGTNDVAVPVDPGIVIGRFRCLRERVGLALGWRTPVVFIGITPTPSRWSGWSQAVAVNEGVKALAARDPGVVYADVPTPLLELGQPPPDRLFVGDRLHLSPEGYAIWARVLRDAVTGALGPSPTSDAPSPAHASGTSWLIDLGPSNAEDGQRVASPDDAGNHWNAWHAVDGFDMVRAGERLASLVDTTGASSSVSLVIAGGFRTNGFVNGGLRRPDRQRLGALGVDAATGDFFFSDDEDIPGGLMLTGLDASKRYTVSIFAARDDGERRVTAYDVSGASTRTVTLQTSGAGAGTSGSTTNDDTVAEVTGVQPDAWGHVFVEVRREEGQFAYVSALELVVE